MVKQWISFATSVSLDVFVCWFFFSRGKLYAIIVQFIKLSAKERRRLRDGVKGGTKDAAGGANVKLRYYSRYYSRGGKRA